MVEAHGRLLSADEWKNLPLFLGARVAIKSGARKLNPNTTIQGRTGWEKSSKPIKGAALDRTQI
jgi:hypothetical protein